MLRQAPNSEAGHEERRPPPPGSVRAGVVLERGPRAAAAVLERRHLSGNKVLLWTRWFRGSVFRAKQYWTVASGPDWSRHGSVLFVKVTFRFYDVMLMVELSRYVKTLRVRSITGSTQRAN